MVPTWTGDTKEITAWLLRGMLCNVAMDGMGDGS